MTRPLKRRKEDAQATAKVVFAVNPSNKLAFSSNDDSPEIGQRRRIQNRVSQRAYRQRQLSHMEDIEKELHNLHEDHDNLQDSFKQKSAEVSGLTACVAELKLEISTMQKLPKIFDVPAQIEVEKAVKSESSPLYSGPHTGSGYTIQNNTLQDWDVRYLKAAYHAAFSNFGNFRT